MAQSRRDVILREMSRRKRALRRTIFSFHNEGEMLRGESLGGGTVISVGVDDGERSLVERNSTIE